MRSNAKSDKPQKKPRVAISACLLGQRVRYDGNDKRATALVDALADSVEWVAMCPETECGLGVPREPMQLIQAKGSVRLIGQESGNDFTAKLENWILKRVDKMKKENIAGLILKARSPSCGINSTPIFGADGQDIGIGSGLFAAAVKKRFPELIIIDEEEKDAVGLLSRIL